MGKLGRRFSYWFSDKKIKIFAIVLIFGLAFADFLAMNNLFAELDLSSKFRLGHISSELLAESTIYSVTFSLLLEGNPLFLGIAASLLADKTKYKVNDKANAIIGFSISLVALIITFALVVVLRIMLIQQKGGVAAFRNGTFGGSDDSNGGFIAQIYLIVAPVLTSMLAFVASWTAFRSEKIEKLERRLDKLHNKYLICQSKFLDEIHRNDDARMVLWRSLTDNELLPATLNVFREQCFIKIQNKLLENSKNSFSDQIGRYNAEIASLLQSYLVTLATNTTTTPRDIENMKIGDIIAEYDAQKSVNNDGEDAWDFSICGKALTERLEKILSNAVVVAQFKTTIKPYHMEGDY